MAASIPFSFGNGTDTGRVRQANEDYYGNWETPSGHLFVVCDGMGGHVGGATASRTAVDAIQQYFARDAVPNPIIGLQQALEAANTAIITAVQSDPSLQGMGTTAVVVLVQLDKVYYAHIGDSRIYLYREGMLQRLTKDHSLVQMLIDSGHITEAEAERHPRKNEISQALGIQPRIEPGICSEPLRPRPGDTLLLCTDGLTGMVPEAGISEVLGDSSLGVQQKAVSLIGAANRAGGVDNITAQLIRFEGAGGRQWAEDGGETKRKAGKGLLVAGLLLLLLAGSAGFVAYRNGWIGKGVAGHRDSLTRMRATPPEGLQPGEVAVPIEDTLLSNPPRHAGDSGLTAPAGSGDRPLPTAGEHLGNLPAPRSASITRRHRDTAITPAGHRSRQGADTAGAQAPRNGRNNAPDTGSHRAPSRATGRHSHTTQNPRP